VTRRRYVRRGLTLVAIKYAGDALLIAAATGKWWTPAHVIDPLALLWNIAGLNGPAWLLPALTLWTFPFVWIAVTISAQRADDAGLSPWVAVSCLLPYVYYVVVAVLCLAPSRVRDAAARDAGRPEATLHAATIPAAAIAIATSTVAGLLMMVISVDLVARYGIAIFFTVPFVIGAVGAFIVNYDAEASMLRTGQVTLAAFFLAATLALALRREGVICIVLAMPLVASVGLLGAALGRSLARTRRDGAASALITLVALPVAILIEPAHTSGRLLHEVTTVVVIDAPPDRVWPQVVSFDRLPEPDDPWFRLGIAYPLYARTAGEAVGAPRACVFSTGVFEERITTWQPARRLTFDVLSSAPPLRELTPYANVHPPHLDGYFRSRRGEFDLVALEGGRTRLEGHSWYELEMAPEGYWQVVADAFVHRVHRRVLEHIRRTAERDGSYLPTASPSTPTSSMWFTRKP
jgi:Polyketide cyclase / dehydrase and lipid transport